MGWCFVGSVGFVWGRGVLGCVGGVLGGVLFVVVPDCGDGGFGGGDAASALFCGELA